MKIKDNEFLVITQKDENDVLYDSNGCINSEHEVVSGYLLDINTNKVVKHLTVKQVLDIIG